MKQAAAEANVLSAPELIQDVGKCKYLCSDADEGWHEHRSKMLTASDIGVLFEITPWSSLAGLQAKKRDGIDDFEPNVRTWTGTQMEVSNMELYAKVVGASVEPCNALFQSKATPLLGATIDGLTWPPRAIRSEIPEPSWYPWLEHVWEQTEDIYLPGLVEMKNCDGWFGNTVKKWGWNPKEKTYSPEDMPEYYWMQVQAQLYVTGLSWAALCAKIDGSSMVTKIILPDVDFHREMVHRVEDFWKTLGD